MIRRVLWGALFSWMVCAAASAAPILQIDGSGKLTGAKGVDVGGVLYDVSFVDGTCVGLYSGCDSAADFAFTTLGTATLASEALRDTVFLNSALGQFDDDPSLTFGCVDPLVCIVVTGYAGDGVHVNVSQFTNDPFDQVSENTGFNATFDTAGPIGGVFTYAVWTPQRTTVPTPGTLAIVGAGLIGLVLARRRRNHALDYTQ